jgi:hypothetical protein
MFCYLLDNLRRRCPPLVGVDRRGWENPFYGNRTSPRVTYIRVIAVFRQQLIITKAHGDQIPKIVVALI